MSATYKSSKVFNLEDRKRHNGKAITEVDIFQWKSVLLEELRKNTKFNNILVPTATWQSSRVTNRGFTGNDAQTSCKNVEDMLTKISSLAPSCLVRAILNRTTCLQDVWSLIYEWAGIQITGSKHLDYYRIKNSYSPTSDETKQEFFYRLRDAMEDTLLPANTDVTQYGRQITTEEDMTPCINSLVVMDWIDAIGGSILVEHIHRVYAKDLESVTLGSLQSRISKNLDSLIHEIEEQKVAQANRTEVLNKLSNLEKNSNVHTHRQQSKQSRSRSVSASHTKNVSRYCKLCKRQSNHSIAFCPQLSPADRSQIAKVRNVISSMDNVTIENATDTENEEDSQNEDNVNEESCSD